VLLKGLQCRQDVSEVACHHTSDLQRACIQQGLNCGCGTRDGLRKRQNQTQTQRVAVACSVPGAAAGFATTLSMYCQTAPAAR
jgi:hypothetical protein